MYPVSLKSVSASTSPSTRSPSPSRHQSSTTSTASTASSINSPSIESSIMARTSSSTSESHPSSWTTMPEASKSLLPAGAFSSSGPAVELTSTAFALTTCWGKPARASSAAEPGRPNLAPCSALTPRVPPWSRQRTAGCRRSARGCRRSAMCQRRRRRRSPELLRVPIPRAEVRLQEYPEPPTRHPCQVDRCRSQHPNGGRSADGTEPGRDSLPILDESRMEIGGNRYRGQWLIKQFRNRGAVQSGGSARTSDPQLVRTWVIDRSGNWLAAADQSDRRAPVRDARQKVVRAVDRVDVPRAVPSRTLGALLTNHRVVRAKLTQPIGDQPLGGLVGARHYVGDR